MRLLSAIKEMIGVAKEKARERLQYFHQGEANGEPNRAPFTGRGLKSYGLGLVVVTRRKDHHGRTVTVMTHRSKGRRWDGPGITGSVRRAAKRSAQA